MTFGLLAIAFGAWLIYAPLGFIAIGIGCVAVAVIGARGQQPASTKKPVEKK
jgi:hypothetical protein